MTKIIRESFCSWPYAQALLWMTQAHERVAKDLTNIIIGCGSHSEKIITIGRNVAYSDHELQNLANTLKVDVHLLERGGGITAHEPGQIVLYPILNLKEHRLSVPDLINLGEEAMIQFLGYFDVEGHRSPKGAGIYIGQAKVGFIGMRIKEGISTHGMALNLFNDAHIFSFFAPCGMPDLAITSLYHHALIQEDLSQCIERLSLGFMAQLSQILSM